MPLPKKLEIADDQVKGRDVKEALNALIEYLTPAPPVPLETMERAEWSNSQTPEVKDWRPNPVKEGWFFDPWGINQRAEHGEVPPEVIERFAKSETE